MFGYPREFELFNDVIDKKIEKGGLKHLGSGGYGDVLLYTSKETDVVIKRVKSGQGCKNLKEFKIHELLSKDGNKHIIQLFDVLKTQKFLFFYLEFAAGGDLEQMIKAKGTLSSTIAKEYFTQMIDGIQFMHGLGIVHRDLKPANLFLTSDGILKIGDFGFATKFRDDEGENMLVTLCGTAKYWAPEVETSKKLVDGPPLDIWPCGIILIEMLTGRRPWEAATLKNMENWISKEEDKNLPWNNIEDDVMSLLRKILVVDPTKRATIDDIQEDKWLSGNKNIENGGTAQPKKDRKRKLQAVVPITEDNGRKRQRVPKKKFSCLE
ncbi:hypothetical protein GCK72_025891 [Caenorhabditis remanei]|uniref:Protein kinase domain-containing protein n=1 Tax=Caenorhabditis remanei TaxID=31234 RepID=A0A6A5G3N7_CAERE|nr:hypothetical protein GCK72_025891 [Caenorhabditis remanei]KAF1749423.1 hypothetical protein GCK72_025891 [Caenorhabditis remanei]